MRKIAIGLAASALLAVAFAGPAHASVQVDIETPGILTTQEEAGAFSPCAPGNFCAWTGTYRGGNRYSWTGNSSRWPDGIRNNAQSVENNGVPHPKERVAMFWGSGHTGAVKDIHRGNWYLELPLCWEKFDRDAGRGVGGMGQCINKNVASHWWW